MEAINSRPNGAGHDVRDAALKAKVSQIAKEYGVSADDFIHVPYADVNGVDLTVLYFAPPDGGAPVGVALAFDDGVNAYVRYPNGTAVGPAN